MAHQPDWTRDEWAVLVDLVTRFEGQVPPSEIQRAHYVLRANALTSDDPRLRRRATDPSFRSEGGVWTQYYLARRTRRARGLAPRRLGEVWKEFDHAPEAVALVAQRTRDRVAGETPYGVADNAAVTLFLSDVASLLDEAVAVIGALPASRAPRELLVTHAAAWQDLQSRDLLADVVDELESAGPEWSLSRVGLTGPQLRFKLTGWLEALSEWRNTRSADALRRAFRWANLILGSLGEALAGPGLEVFKEFKEGTEAVLDAATLPGGYLPAPAYS